MCNKDIIYHQVKLVLVINCLCGLFSVKNCFGDSCKKLRFQFFSWHYIYSIGLIAFYLTITILASEPTDCYHFRRLNYAIQCEYVMWICLMQYTNRIYILVLSKVQAVDLQLQFSSAKLTNLWIYFLYMLHLFTCTCNIYLKIQSNRKLIQGILEFCFSYMISIRTFATLPYVVTANAIGHRFYFITKELQNKLNQSEKTSLEIEKCRMLHFKLCSITESLISSFSLPITLFFGFAYFDILVRVGSMVENKNFDTLVDPLVLTITSLLGYLIISASEDLFQAGQSISNVIQDVPLSKKPNKFHMQLKQFTLQIKSTAIKVSAGNYFLLRKRTFPGIVGSMTSFLVVVVQLSPYFNHLCGKGPVLGNATESSLN